MHVMTDNHTPKWRLLWDISYALGRLEHPLHLAFSNVENAIANAIRSRTIPVRGRRGDMYGCTPSGSAFERIEQYLVPKADINVLLNQIIIPSSAATLR